jgi:hypothetical protein
MRLFALSGLLLNRWLLRLLASRLVGGLLAYFFVFLFALRWCRNIFGSACHNCLSLVEPDWARKTTRLQNSKRLK